MSNVEPKIHELLNESENDRFLLCAMASQRAHDITDMMRGQRNRAKGTDSAKDIAVASNVKPLTIAFNEIHCGEISYDPETIDAIHH